MGSDLYPPHTVYVHTHYDVRSERARVSLFLCDDGCIFYAVVYSEIAIEEYDMLDKSKMSRGDLEYARSELILVLSVFSTGAGCVFLFTVVKLVSLIY